MNYRSYKCSESGNLDYLSAFKTAILCQNIHFYNVKMKWLGTVPNYRSIQIIQYDQKF